MELIETLEREAEEEREGRREGTKADSWKKMRMRGKWWREIII